MPYTAEDIYNKAFAPTQGMDGYAISPVDDFLDELANQIEESESMLVSLKSENENLIERNIDLENKLSDLQNQLSIAHSQSSQKVTDHNRLEANLAQLESKLAQTESKLSQAESKLAQHNAFIAAPKQPDPASQTQGMLQLAMELHDKHIREGEETKTRLIIEGEEAARRLVSDAHRQRSDEIAKLNIERSEIEFSIKELRDFESEYRATLKSYITSQLSSLESSKGMAKESPVG